MISNNLITYPNKSIKYSMNKINQNGFRGVVVVDKNYKLKGFLSDGDLRKFILKNENLNSSINNIYKKECFSLYKNDLFKINIDELISKYYLIPVINKNHKVLDIITIDNYKSFFNHKQKSQYSGLIFAGGKGLRMGAISKVIPKPLLMVNDIPLIEINYKYLKFFKIQDIYLSLNYKKEMIKSYFKEKSLDAKYLIEKKPLGTAGPLGLINESDISKGIICLNCDNIFEADLKKIIKFHENNKNDFTIVTTIYETNVPYGVLNTNDNKLISIGEKPNLRNEINTGLYIINKKLLKFIKAKKSLNMNNFIELLLAKNIQIGTYKIKFDQFRDYGTSSKLNLA